MNEDKTKSGLVSIIGRSNVGKSTLLNHLIEHKVSITSRKPQTTRFRVLGIKTKGLCQAVIIDTPGYHRGQKRALNKYCLLYTSPSPRDRQKSRMPSSA